jgi:hypothetical protein
MTKDAPVETIPDVDPEEVVDAAVTKVVKEKRSVSDGFDDMGGVRGKTSNDGNQGERVEVRFCLYALLHGVMYSLGVILLTWLFFTCCAQASLPVVPTQAPSSHFNVKLVEDDVVTLSSNYTEEAIELLYLSPARGPHSQLSELRSRSGSDLFDDWPKANDMVTSVYVVLTAYALSSRVSIVSAPHCARKSCADDPSTRQSHTRANLPQKPQW